MGQARPSGVIGAGGLMLVGITHREARLEILEQAHVDRDASAALAGVLVALPGVGEAVVLSTCNRTELYLHGSAPDAQGALRALAAIARCEPDLLERFAFRRSGVAVADHLLRVTAGLESRITGEFEVFGQVRAAIAAARAAGTAGPNLASLFRFAVAAGRRAQRASGAAPPSLPRLALRAGVPDAASRPARTIVLGSGSVARGMTEELRRRGLDYSVCARRPERAARLVASPDDVLRVEELTSALGSADLLVCATAARSPLVRVGELERVAADRTGRHLTIVDLCLPRAVEPDARNVAGIRLFDLDDLVTDASATYVLGRRQAAAAELQRYELWLAGRTIGSTISHLQEHVHATCRGAAQDSGTTASSADAQAVAAHARRTSRRMLHPSLVTIKRLVADGDTDAALAIVASFGADPVRGPAALRRAEPLTQEAS